MPPREPTLSPHLASALDRALRRAMAGQVRFDDGARALYATDASNYRQVPIGVVWPRSIADVEAAMRVCQEYEAPVLSRGGGTSLAGQCCNEAVVIDCSRHLNRVLEVDARARRARVEPGCVLDTLRDAAELHHLTFGPDPSTHNHNTLGGMIGNNSCGVHSVMAGRTSDNVDSLDVLTYDGVRMRVGATSRTELDRMVREPGRRGEIYRRLHALPDRYGALIRARFPNIPRRVSGFALDQLLPENGFHVARALVGTEGTCVFVCEATLCLVSSPPARALAVIGFDDIVDAGNAVPQVLECRPLGVEGLDEVLTTNLRQKHLHEHGVELLPRGRAWLLAEFGGETAEEACANARAVESRVAPHGCAGVHVIAEPAQQKQLWAVRESGLGATARVPGEPDTWEGWEDAAVPPERLGVYLRDFRALLGRHGLTGALYGHFGDGCVHTRISFDLASAAGVRQFRTFVDEAADLVLHYGGSFSGEHGDGQARAELLPKMYGPELVQAFREFKAIWDPAGRMNPGKAIDAYPITANLRLGAGYAAHEPRTRFAFTNDEGRFSRAALRCVGVGECRRAQGGVMCPSYRATGEEQHSTRGRARLLFEMLQDAPLERGWRSDAVHEALDLCLACKGCKRDCPVNVDMATYKAEFNAHYYAGRMRPRAAYSMGLIWWWCRAAHLAPRMANLLTQSRGLSTLAKLAGGIHPHRCLPPFAHQTFRGWYAKRAATRPPAPPGHSDRLILFPDTFNNYFNPEVAIAAIEALEAAGYSIHIPPRPLCCGRPLYAWGMLDAAVRLLRDTLAALEEELAAGTPILVLEPSCAAAFRDELPDLLPRDPRAHQLAARTILLADLLQRRRGYEPPGLAAKALVHVHCHQHALFGSAADRMLMRRMGLEARMLDAGCCGMAGSFGFEAGHHEVAMRIGELALLPAVRAADDQTLIVTNGFSCREQIGHGAQRTALHLAQVLQRAAREQRSRA